MMLEGGARAKKCLEWRYVQRSQCAVDCLIRLSALVRDIVGLRSGCRVVLLPAQGFSG